MAVVFNKQLQEQVSQLDMAFLALYRILINKGYMTKEEFDEEIKKITNGGKENETGNKDIHI